MEHVFKAQWISNAIFSNLHSRNIFHRQLEDKELDCSEHNNPVGNSFVYGFDLCPDAECKNKILKLFDDHGIDSLSFFHELRRCLHGGCGFGKHI